MKKQILVAMLVSAYSIANAQSPNSNNYLQLVLDNGVNFALNIADHLENDQTIQNCFHLRVKSRRKNAVIYASIPSGIVTSSQTSMPVSILKIKFSHTTCPSNKQQNVVYSDIYMSPSNQLLFQQRKDNNLIADWYYDLNIPALGYSYTSGTYNYTFLFTMTQP